MLCVKLKDSGNIKSVKSWLELKGYLNKSRKICTTGDEFTIYTNTEDTNALEELIGKYPGLSIDSYEDTRENSDTSLDSIVEQYLQKRSILVEGLKQYIPKRWVVYEPMVLFNNNTFDTEAWQSVLGRIDSQDFFKTLLVKKFPHITHAAVNQPINKSSIMRVPENILPLYGHFEPEVTSQMLELPTESDFKQAFWCHTIQNGIYQTWAPRFTMFSRGNIKEKKRILDTFKNLNNTWVLDLYGGIGYFSLSYLKNGAKLMCWELNPWSTEALIRNCQMNNFSFKLNPTTYDESTQVYIFNENNEHSIKSLHQVMSNPSSLPISHINLGLLPSSKQSWDMTTHFMTLSSMSPVVHVHENVHIDQFELFTKELMDYFPNTKLVSINKVKTFAPDVWHTVFDIC